MKYKRNKQNYYRTPEESSQLIDLVVKCSIVLQEEVSMLSVSRDTALPCVERKSSGAERLEKQVANGIVEIELPVLHRLAPQGSVTGPFCHHASKSRQTKYFYIESSSIQIFGTKQVGVPVPAVSTSSLSKGCCSPNAITNNLRERRSHARRHFRPRLKILLENIGVVAWKRCLVCHGSVLGNVGLGRRHGSRPFQDRTKR